MQAVNVIFVPVPMPTGTGDGGYCKPGKPKPYPRQTPVPWRPREAIPAPDHRAVRALIEGAKRLLAEQRASRLLRELGG
jgi:hypothetical protein